MAPDPRLAELSRSLANAPSLQSDGGSKGTFFQQLRGIEGQLERAQNEKDGLKAVVHSLQGEVGAAAAKHRRLLHAVEEAREKSDTGRVTQIAWETDLQRHQSTLIGLDEELATLHEQCEETKKKVEQLSRQIQRTTPEEIEGRVAGKRELERVVAEESRKLAVLKTSNRSNESRIAVLNSKRKVDSDRIMAASDWMGQRAALVSKVRKARRS
jgi:chromosome segregation ATPase